MESFASSTLLLTEGSSPVESQACGSRYSVSFMKGRPAGDPVCVTEVQLSAGLS